MTIIQQQYFEKWHDVFVAYVKNIVTIADTFKLMSNISDSDKQHIDTFKAILHSQDVKDIENDLAKGIVKRSTLDKIEKLNKDMIDYAIKHMSGTQFNLMFLKKISYCQIEYNKQAGISQLVALHIPILDC